MTREQVLAALRRELERRIAAELNLDPNGTDAEGDTNLPTKQTNLSEKSTAQKRIVIKVERVDDDVFRIPEKLTLEQADQVLHDRMAFDNKKVSISAEIDTPLVLEAAYALYEVLNEKFGWADMTDTPTMFGPEPPVMISVPVGPGRSVQVPLGRFKVPTIKSGYLESVIQPKKRGGPAFFFINGEVKRVDEDRVNDIVEAVRERVRTKSVYKGQAFGIQLVDEMTGELHTIPQVRFLALDERVEQNLILPDITQASVQANVFTPIEYTQTLRDLGIGLKRGVLLAGPPGTGKTMIANAAAVKAVRNGHTYIVCEHPRELAEVIRIARSYQFCVVFCEDLDRLISGEERTMAIDEILNVVDGVESKGTEIMVVFTSNDLSRISTPMLRPGRLDAVIPIGPPDADAAEALMRLYGHGRIPATEALTRAGEELAGSIPAVIQQAAEGAMLYAIKADTDPNTLVIDDEALYHSAAGMREHRALLSPKAEDRRSETLKAAQELAAAIRETPGATVVPFPIRNGADTLGTDRVFAQGANESPWGHKPGASNTAPAVEAALDAVIEQAAAVDADAEATAEDGLPN